MDYRSTRALDLLLSSLDPGAKDQVLASLGREVERIRAMPAGPSRARWLHERVEAALAQFSAQQPEVISQVRCHRGCAHCCRLWVGVTRDEAELLAELAATGAAAPDLDRMALQQDWHSPMDFLGKPPEQAACVFLGPDGACTVYADRPSICRAYLVASDPELCRGGVEGAEIRSVVNPYVEILVAAALTVDAEADPPPRYGRHLSAALAAAQAD
jgi:Fe-S-cluster containining protein